MTNEYFKPWRRKAACVTLVAAALFVSGWIRSRNTVDLMKLYFAGMNVYMVSGGETILLWTNFEPGMALTSLKSEAVVHVGICFIPESQRDMFPNQTFLWYSIVATRAKVQPTLTTALLTDETDSVPMIPYWKVAMPLTLLSAYLLLWKPRRNPSPD